MQPARPDESESGRFYKVGENWYVDEAYVRKAATHRAVQLHEEPFGYRLLSPFGMLNLRPEPGTAGALPHQSGTLYLCGRTDEAGSQLHALAREYRLGEHGGTWTSWPAPSAKGGKSGKSCGCTSCQHGGTCPSKAAASTAHLVGLLTSETLGTLVPQDHDPTTITLDVPPRRHSPPEWICGRRHECIREVLQWSDVGAGAPVFSIVLADWPARASYHLRWAVVLDRRRTALLEDIVHHAVHLATKIAKGLPAHPEPPPVGAPGAFAWASAAMEAVDAKSSNCSTCPYQLGSNLRCSTCRAWHHARAQPRADLRRKMARELSEQAELRSLPPQALAALALASEQIFTTTRLEPLTDAFFVLLERGLLVSTSALEQPLTAKQVSAILEIAEEFSFSVTGPRPREAA